MGTARARLQDVFVAATAVMLVACGTCSPSGDQTDAFFDNEGTDGGDAESAEPDPEGGARSGCRRGLRRLMALGSIRS
jgi:hypothetical protein